MNKIKQDNQASKLMQLYLKINSIDITDEHSSAVNVQLSRRWTSTHPTSTRATTMPASTGGVFTFCCTTVPILHV